MSKFNKSFKLSSEYWILSVLGVLSLFVQFSFITKASIWHDEGYSLLLAPLNSLEIIERTARDVHPPLYYLVLHFWTGLFGNSELAARSLSALCIAGLILVMYKLIKHLYGLKPAQLSAVLLVIAPFLVRYGQEARMYALVAFLIGLATYLVVSAMDFNKKTRLYLYALVMAAAFYTHYYAIFIVPVHWLYVTLATPWKQPRIAGAINLKSWHWWCANVSIVALFAPWLSTLFQQVSRVQGGFWIPPVSSNTLATTLTQWLYFNGFSLWPNLLRLMIPMTFLALTLTVLYLNKQQRKSTILLLFWTALPPLLVFEASLFSRPIYVDRYFVFSTAAFYPLLACLLYLKPLNYLYKLRPALVVSLLILFTFGLYNVYKQSNHKMRDVGQFVNQNYQTGDEIVAAELYVYFDFSYYNATNTKTKLYAPTGVNGYGETSLLYDKPELLIKNFNDLKPANKRIWVVGKSGEKDYYRLLPDNWTFQTSIEAKDSVARLYLTP